MRRFVLILFILSIATFPANALQKTGLTGLVTAVDGKLAPSIIATPKPVLRVPRPGNNSPRKYRPARPGDKPNNRTIPKTLRRDNTWTPPRTCTAKPTAIDSYTVQSNWTCSPTGRLTKTQCSQVTCVTTTNTLPPQPGATAPPNSTPPTAKPLPDINWLVDNAIEQIPKPQPNMSPPFQEGNPNVKGVVGIPVFFAVNTNDWRPHSATATDGTYHLTVTATPQKLTFDSGYNAATKTCTGPGKRVTNFDPKDAREGPGCRFTYQQSTRENKNFDASLTITWTTSVITDIEPETLVTNRVPDTIETTTQIAIPMVEIQAVLR